jgi:hypothetical protein
MTETEKLREAIDLGIAAYERLFADLNNPKLSKEDLIQKHKDGFKETTNKVYDLTRLPEPEIIIEIDANGAVERVLTNLVPQTVVVRYTETVFNPHEAFDSEVFQDYKEYIKDAEEENEPI